MKTIVRDKDGAILCEYFSGVPQPGIEFHTPPDCALQVGTMKRPGGYVIQPHSHKPIQRHTVGNQEVLLILNGVLEMSIYDRDKALVTVVTLLPGDFAIFYAGGHGFRAKTEVEIFEVKQGPYVGEADKERF